MDSGSARTGAEGQNGSTVLLTAQNAPKRAEGQKETQTGGNRLHSSALIGSGFPVMYAQIDARQSDKACFDCA